jgi:hypothetical protein
MGRNLFKSLLLFATGLFAVSCLIDNDMSYPSTEAVILSMQVEGQKSITINAVKKLLRVGIARRIQSSIVTFAVIWLMKARLFYIRTITFT